MPLEPLHPDEPELHHQLRNAFNQSLTSTDFFVWISVRPTGRTKRFEDLEKLVRETEQWLSERSPDQVDASELPELELSDPAAEIQIRAVPKKPSARSHRAAEIVGNPEPALAGWGP